MTGWENNKLSKIIVESRTRCWQREKCHITSDVKVSPTIFRLSEREEMMLWFDCCLAAFSALLSERELVHSFTAHKKQLNNRKIEIFPPLFPSLVPPAPVAMEIFSLPSLMLQS